MHTTANISNDTFRELQRLDRKVYNLALLESRRQNETISLIASENIPSMAVLLAMATGLNNKVAEGYPGHRYHGGCEVVDKIERLAIDRVKRLFKAEYANVQPHSGSQANQAVIFSLLQNKRDKILGMALDHGGHLTHGAPASIVGKYFTVDSYGVDKKSGLLDYDNIRKIAKQSRPKLIIAGASAYPRVIDFQKFKEIADEIDAYLLADIAHLAGLIIANIHPSPINYAHFTTSSTYKTLRGPRSGFVVMGKYHRLKTSEGLYLSQKLDKTIFPGLQGTPHEHVIAAKAVCFLEACKRSFIGYQNQVVNNAKILAKSLTDLGIDIVTGGTDTHIVLIDLSQLRSKNNKSITGVMAERLLARLGILTNRNKIPFDKRPATITSGLRLGTALVTTRGMREKEMRLIANLIYEVLSNLVIYSDKIFFVQDSVIKNITTKIKDLIEQFPVFSDMSCKSFIHELGRN